MVLRVLLVHKEPMVLWVIRVLLVLVRLERKVLLVVDHKDLQVHKEQQEHKVHLADHKVQLEPMVLLDRKDQQVFKDHLVVRKELKVLVVLAHKDYKDQMDHKAQLVHKVHLVDHKVQQVRRVLMVHKVHLVDHKVRKEQAALADKVLLVHKELKVHQMVRREHKVQQVLVVQQEQLMQPTSPLEQTILSA
jgi:hypothetical protein